MEAATSKRNLSSVQAPDQGRQLARKAIPVPPLNAFQRECIDFFVHGTAVFSLPRSFGEIYGLLFSTSEPLSMDEIMARLRISKGSASQGLRWLKAVGAARSVYVEGDRRDHFVAEVELRTLASGFLREQIQPHLESGSERLRRLEQTLDAGKGTRPPEFEAARMRKLKTWLKFSNFVLPVLQKLTADY